MLYCASPEPGNDPDMGSFDMLFMWPSLFCWPLPLAAIPPAGHTSPFGFAGTGISSVMYTHPQGDQACDTAPLAQPCIVPTDSAPHSAPAQHTA